MKRSPAQGPRAPAARRATTSTRTSPRATTPGTSVSAPSPTATSSRPSATGAPRWSPTHRALHRDRHPLASGERAPGGHRRHGHRARAALPGRDRPHVDGEPVDPAEPAHLQGHDARGRPEPGRRHRLHERVVDAQVRPHVRVRVPPPQPHAQPRSDASACRATPMTLAVDGGPLLGLTSGYIQRSAHLLPNRERASPGRCTRATCATTVPCA